MKNNYSLQIGKDNKVLRTKSANIKEITPEIKKFTNMLTQLMNERDGVWLAAPQIWENIRIISTTQRKEWKKWEEDILQKETIMINPEIIEKSIEQEIWEEACLSLPGITWHVKRHKKITVKYIDIKNNTQTKKFKNFNARIIQHEIDHLDAILFIDRI